jgi:4-hydroxy-tetrahydrodipicolinate synthase
VLAETDLAYYTGCDEYVLALYAIGGAGYIGTVANVVPRQFRSVIDAFDAGDTAEAARLQRRAIRLTELMMSSGLPGTVTAKALLGRLGLPSGPVRAPLRPADREVADGLLAAYEELVSG